MKEKEEGKEAKEKYRRDREAMFCVIGWKRERGFCYAQRGSNRLIFFCLSWCRSWGCIWVALFLYIIYGMGERE